MTCPMNSRPLTSSSRRDSRPRLSDWATPSFLAAVLKNAFILVRSVLSEIFDESAYNRFLSRQRLPDSPESYAAFLREHELIKARRPRCC